MNEENDPQVIHKRFPGPSSGKPVRRIRVSEEEMRAAKAILENPDAGVKFELNPGPKENDESNE